jgi:hypothetical protein
VILDPTTSLNQSIMEQAQADSLIEQLRAYRFSVYPL